MFIPLSLQKYWATDKASLSALGTLRLRELASDGNRSGVSLCLENGTSHWKGRWQSGGRQ